MPRVLDIDVLPFRHRNGKYVLKEITTFDEFVPGWRRIHKNKVRIWPETKMENGRGIEFDTQREALEYYLEHRTDASQEGQRTKLKLASIRKRK